MSSDVEIKLAELAKDYQNLKERHSEFLLDVKTHNVNVVEQMRNLTDNISDLYNQIEQTRLEGDRNNSSLLEKIKDLKRDMDLFVKKQDSIDDVLKSSLWNRLMKELSDSKLIPIIKWIFWITIIVLATKGLIPDGWIKV